MQSFGSAPGIGTHLPPAPQVTTGAAAMPRGPVTGGTPAQPGTLQLQNPNGLSLTAGMTLKGQVLARQGDLLTLQFGRTQITASTSLPLAPGEHVQVQVQGQQGGKWSLQLLQTHLFTRMSEGDLASDLMTMKMPVQPSNLMAARALVEQNLPLTRESMQDMNQTLAQLPREATPQDAMSAAFLKGGNLPATPHNVLTLSSFVTQHPFLGSQLFSVQQTFRRLVESSSGRLPREVSDLLTEVPGLLGQLVVEPRTQTPRKRESAMKRMAFQAGIECMGPHVGDDFDYAEWLKIVREFLSRHAAEHAELAGAAALLGEVADNLEAQRLVNHAASAAQGSFFLQLPLREPERTAEVRLIYHRDVDGEPRVSERDTEIELAVPTCHLGDLRYQISVKGTRLFVDVSVENDTVAAHVERYLPVLVDNLERIGYHVQGLGTTTRFLQPTVLPSLVREPLEQMERVSISA